VKSCIETKQSKELTADVSDVAGAVRHGAGVGPSLSVGCTLVVPALWTERPLLDMHSGHLPELLLDSRLIFD